MEFGQAIENNLKSPPNPPKFSEGSTVRLSPLNRKGIHADFDGVLNILARMGRGTVFFFAYGVEWEMLSSHYTSSWDELRGVK